MTTIDATITAEKGDSILATVNDEYRQVMRQVMDDMRAAMLADFSRRAVTRVGGRGAQVEQGDVTIQAAHVEHEASRAGDPHLHQHCLISVRVRDSAGTWRGLWTRPAMPDLIAAREAAYAVYVTHPKRLDWLSEHGYTTTPEGRIAQLESLLPPFSQRHGQIAGNREQYEQQWRAEHPGATPPAELRAMWDTIGWRDGRPGKDTYADLADRTRERLAGLGYDPILPGAGPALEPAKTGSWADVNVEQVANAAVADLEGQASAWNLGQIRAAAGRAARAAGIAANVADSPQRVAVMVDQVEIAMAARMHSVLDGDRLPTRATKHLTSERVEREHDQLEEAFRQLAGPGGVSGSARRRAVAAGLNAEQADAAALVCGASRIGVIVGRAGTGKTTMLRSAREHLDGEERCMIGVAPTLRAAGEVSDAVGIPADSVHRLLMEHGWRRDGDGSWRQLPLGEVEVAPDGSERAWTGPREPYAAPATSVLVVDEAGMLAVPEAAALVQLASDQGWHLRLVGDPRQLAQVGRGGVMDTAVSWAGDDQTVTMEEVVRHVRPVTRDDGETEWAIDADYSGLLDRLLTAASDDERRAIAEELFDRGESGEPHGAVVLAPAPADAQALAAAARARDDTLIVVAATNDEVRAVHDAERALTLGTDRPTVAGMEGQRIGAGDTVATRRNDRQFGVRNREMWTVRELHDDGSITVVGRDKQDQARRLPAGYVCEHVQGAGAGTGHGWQGHTGDDSLVLLSERTGQRGLYVGLSRGRRSNRLLVAAPDREQAVARIVAALGRDGADLGLSAARERANSEALPLAASHQPAARQQESSAERRLGQPPRREGQPGEQRPPMRWPDVTIRRRAWREWDRAVRSTKMRDDTHAEQVAGLREKAQADRRSAERARHAAAVVGRGIDDTARWQQLGAALEAQAGAARIVEGGPGLLGRRRHQVEEAQARYRDLRKHTGRDVDGGLARDQVSQVVADARQQLVNKQAQLEQEADQNDAHAHETERTISALTTNRTAQREEETVRAATLGQRLRAIDHVRSSVPVDERKQLDSEAIRQRQAAARRQQHTVPAEGATIGRDAAGLEL
ncbi:MAG: AAA family ATPase [Actinomycetota bacterium]|nr:AAA family ATPase [Actinomycetota bacterium]